MAGALLGDLPRVRLENCGYPDTVAPAGARIGERKSMRSAVAADRESERKEDRAA
jgi:hypothetical protein